jgi:replicative DNA helicase
MSDRLPQNIEAETLVLGLMITSRKCLAEGMTALSTEHFHKKSHSLVFSGIKSLFEIGRDVSLISLSEKLKASNSLDAVGGSIKLGELVESSISDTEFSTYLDILQDKAIKRKIISATDDIMKRGYEDSMEQDEFLKYTMAEIWKATPYYSSSVEVISKGDFYERRKKDLIYRQTKSQIKFDWEPLDNLIVSGLNPGDISIIAGRPGMGKSSFKTNLILNLLKSRRGVLSFALEQGFMTEHDRLESLMTQIPLQEIITSRNWKKGDYRVDLVKKTNVEIDSLFNYHVVPSRGVSVSDVRSLLYQLTQKTQIDVIFFDLFDKLVDVNVASNKAQTVGVKLGEMARIAEEFNCHICNLVQINRQVERRSDKHPIMSDLKDSGSFDEVARLILLLYREKYYFPDSLNNELEIIVAKQSNGPLGSVLMEFNEETLALTPLEETNLGGF